MYLILKFDGFESFIGHIQVAVKRSQSTRTSLRHHSIETHRKSEGHSKNQRYAKFSTAFRKMRYLFGKAQNLTAMEDNWIKRHVYPTI